MQRAAAAENASSAPSTPIGRPAKRARLSSGPGSVTYGAPSTPEISDHQRLQAAKAQEELQRNAVMARLAAEAGETHWVLNVKEPTAQTTTLNVVQAGFADLDAKDDHHSESGEESDQDDMTSGFVAGRMVFGQVSIEQWHLISITSQSACRT